MFYYLHLWEDVLSPLRVLQYISVRTVAGAGTAFLVSVILGPVVIRWLQRLKLGQYVRNGEAPDLYALHAAKEGTPTMGGILIIASIFISSMLWVSLTNIYIWLVLSTMCYMGAVGALDDYISISRQRSKGLRSRVKFALQFLWVVIIGFLLMGLPETCVNTSSLMVPFFKEPVIQNMGPFFTILFLVFVIVGASNAVNLTDGLDGLAVGCSSSAALSYLVMAYVAGHISFAEYLNVPYVDGSGELAVFCGCMMGACLGFLWFNCHPAQVFMGDTGSLALGGSIAMVAVLVKQELVLIIVGGVFVIEAMSVILQVLSFKLTGKRIFAMAPLHHHFEMKKWSETQVTVRFWILSIIFALLGVLTLKLR
jgi:phospho-N-acetylmuramoyl-pentapeptide-transferase